MNAATDLFTRVASRCAIERELGSGGMAPVYLAEDVKHARKVACFGNLTRSSGVGPRCRLA